MWVYTGSPLVAEICAGAGLDWLLLDGEHSPIGLESTLALLQAVAAYPVTPMVRVPANDPVALKQYLDLGAQNLLVPMVDTVQQAVAAVGAVRYPPRGVRGVGSALARTSRWNRVDEFLTRADDFVSLFVQIESAAGVESASEIAAVDGVDGVFVGPPDLAASMGLLGQQTHPEVTAAVLRAFAAVGEAGKPVGVAQALRGDAQLRGDLRHRPARAIPCSWQDDVCARATLGSSWSRSGACRECDLIVCSALPDAASLRTPIRLLRNRLGRRLRPARRNRCAARVQRYQPPLTGAETQGSSRRTSTLTQGPGAACPGSLFRAPPRPRD
jgi:4-hydroxy-2-oxoheptanedioate aldolase